MLELLHKNNNNLGVFVAATHLKAKPEFEEQRKQQVQLLIQEFPAFINGKKWPTFILGDFNDIPQSAPIKFMQEHYTSAYDNTDKGYWTTWKKREDEVKRIIDYIFYDPKLSTLEAVLPPPDSPTHLPDTFYPSDHLAICAKFSY